jgi:conjugal transfer/type IV secretion protein DotA/TraY
MSSELSSIADPSTIPATDQSKQILDQLFGTGWNVPGSLGNMSESTSLLFDLMGTFNSVAITVGVLILAWSMTQGIVGTAHEGKFLGQRMHSVWAPFRAGLSISLLAPVFKGICAIQLICLLCIGSSVKLANTLWTSSLDYIGQHYGQVYDLSVPPSLDQSTRALAKGILKSLAIQYHQEIFEEEEMPADYAHVEWREDKQDTKFMGDGYYDLRFRAPARGPMATGLADVDMGRVVVPTMIRDSKISQARIDSVYQMINDLAPLARSIVEKMHPKYDTGAPIDKSLLQKAIDNYNKKLSALIPQILTEHNTEYEENLQNFVSQAKKDGWLFAGAYYWNISGYADMIHKIADDEPTYHDGNEELLMKVSTDELVSVLGGVNIVAEQVEASMDAVQNSAPESTGFWKIANKLSRDVFGKYTIDLVTSKLMNGDPIANLSSLGHIIINTTYSGIAAAALLKASIDGSKSLGGWWKKFADGASGGFVGALQKSAASMVGLIVPVFLFLLIPFFCMGLSLAYYLPAMPFIAWLTATIGWLLLVMETIFAAPLWAVAHALPEGEGMAGQHGRTGYMMLLAVLVRPPLMVVGFMCAVIIMPLIGSLSGLTFMVFSRNMAGNHFTGITTCIAMTFLIGFVMVLVSHKVFKLITHLPDTVTKWVGQTIHNLGEDGDEQRTRAMFTGAVGKVEGAGGASMRPKVGGAGRPKAGMDAYSAGEPSSTENQF